MKLIQQMELTPEETRAEELERHDLAQLGPHAEHTLIARLLTIAERQQVQILALDAALSRCAEWSQEVNASLDDLIEAQRQTDVDTNTIEDILGLHQICLKALDQKIDDLLGQ